MTNDTASKQNAPLNVSEHPRLSEFDKLVYPVVSRRAGGLSLGINLNPDKGCNFRCVYCQVDRTTPKIELTPSLLQIKNELKSWLDQIKKNQYQYQGHTLKDISIAGDGEPTSIKILPETLDLLVQFTKKYHLDACKLILFTNGTEIHKDNLQKSLKQFIAHNGEIWFKLDFWDQKSLKLINRTKYSFDQIINNLISMGKKYPIVLQSCIFNWKNETFDIQNYKSYIELLKRLLVDKVNIKTIQLYTLSRIPTDKKATAWSDENMSEFGNAIRSQVDVNLEVIYSKGKEK